MSIVQSPMLPPGWLKRAAATELAGLIAADLCQLISGIEQLGLVVPGTLYDLTELLRPGWPLLEALESTYRGTLRHDGFTPQVIALGSDDAQDIPMQALNPARRPGSGPLLVLPMVLFGPSAQLEGLAATLEEQLLQHGQVSEATRAYVQQAFALQALNFSYATLGDVCALTRLQLEGQGLEPFWQLLEHTLLRPHAPTLISLAEGNRFFYHEGEIHSPFYTFDDWAQGGPGHSVPASEMQAGYSAWLLRQRQYSQALAAHGLKTQFWLGAQWPYGDAHTLTHSLFHQGVRLEGDYLVECVLKVDAGAAARLLITHQTLEQLGTVAYTVLTLDAHDQLLALEHYYPLTAYGLNTSVQALRTRAQEHNLGYQVLHPQQGLIISTAQRRLTAEGLPEQLVARN